MRIKRLIWTDERVEHIARHNVTPVEVEQVCFSANAVLSRAKSQGPNPTYYVLGRTWAGRYLFCVVVVFPDGNAFAATARPMSDRERRRYQQRRSP